MAETRTKLTTTWTGLLQGEGRVGSATIDLPLAIPQSHGGTGAGSHPKELLMASAAACYAMTIAGMLAARKIEQAGLTVVSELSDASNQGMQITHQVQIELPSNATQEQLDAVESLIEAADKSCMIGNLLKAAGVRIEASGQVETLLG